MFAQKQTDNRVEVTTTGGINTHVPTAMLEVSKHPVPTFTFEVSITTLVASDIVQLVVSLPRFTNVVPDKLSGSKLHQIRRLSIRFHILGFLHKNEFILVKLFISYISYIFYE